MKDSAIWQPLRDLLDQYGCNGRTAKLWLRDDDAIEPTLPLERLLELAAGNGMPLTLAVIPALTGEALAVRLRDKSGVTVAVHGWSHENHAAAGNKKQELGLDRATALVLSQLKTGFDRLKNLYVSQFVPVLVPPWNRIAPTLIQPLGGLGYRAVSVYGRAKAAGSIAEINTHVDIMNWHGVRGCRPHAELVDNLVAELIDRLQGNDEPIGILTHHLVHDEAAWDFVARLFEETKASPAVAWHGLRDLL